MQLAHRRYLSHLEHDERELDDVDDVISLSSAVEHDMPISVEKSRVPGKPARMKTKAEYSLVSTDIVTLLEMQESTYGTQLSTSRQHQPPTQSSTLVTST